jgi:hypothetical protein
MAEPSRPSDNRRLCDAHQGPLTLFVIGMRINHFHRPDKWLPVARAMPRMLKELLAMPDRPLLNAELALSGPRTIITLQYWRSFEALHAYAMDQQREHVPAWRAFNRAARGNNAVGIFHETYNVAAGGHETLYVDMPAFGLGKASGLREASGRLADARGRFAHGPTD